MRKGTRNALAAAGAVVLLAAGAAYWLYASLDGLVKRAIERWGPEITGVAVKVQGVKIEPAQGRGTIRGLFVGNPKGFEAPHALTLGEMRLTLDPASLAKDVIVVKELVLVAPDVVYERGPGGNNLDVIQRHVDVWVAQHSGADSGPGKKLVIENAYVRDGKAHFGATLSAPLPDLHLRNIGKSSNGATAGEVVQQVWGAMLRSATGIASRLGSAVKEGAKGAAEGVKKLFK
ncbi:MAG TPA: hypothetical protein VMI15_02605 [Burkholderiales bacterium]|nr:hypothetical protein [Burkholderiales bacterium]